MAKKVKNITQIREIPIEVKTLTTYKKKKPAKKTKTVLRPVQKRNGIAFQKLQKPRKPKATRRKSKTLSFSDLLPSELTARHIGFKFPINIKEGLEEVPFKTPDEVQDEILKSLQMLTEEEQNKVLDWVNNEILQTRIKKHKEARREWERLGESIEVLVKLSSDLPRKTTDISESIDKQFAAHKA